MDSAEGGTTWKYDRHAYEAEKRDALDRWAARLQEILAVEEVKGRQGGRS